MMGRQVVMAVALLTVAALAVVSGCKAVAEKAVEDATGIKVDEDEGSVTIEGEDGSKMTYGEGSELPRGYPDDAPVYDGAISASWTSEDEKGVTYGVTIAAEDSPETVAAWYEGQLQDKGWEIKTTFKDASNVMITAEKGEMTFNLAAAAEDKGTDITQIIGPKQ